MKQEVVGLSGTRTLMKDKFHRRYGTHKKTTWQTTINNDNHEFIHSFIRLIVYHSFSKQ